ncbi:MAG TPA: glycosyltransferase family 1 protein [Pyrinomonadaceae bacterium]|jgi:glycosyltransferase involved in cell wall biosynthesis
MRILYDGHVYGWQAAGGINRYFANVIGGLPGDFAPALLVGESREVNFPAHPNLKVYEHGRHYPRLGRFSFRLGLYASRLRDLLLTERLARGRFDVVHPTYYSLLTGRGVGSHRAPTVLTVWDMIHELFPEEMDPAGEYAEEKRRGILAADRVICISENTKRDLLARHPVPEEKVVVTHLASELDASLADGPEPVPARPFYLYVGSRSRYKNFDGLLVALARAVASRPDLALCVVGPPFTPAEERRLAELRLNGHVEHYGYAGDAQLAKLYRHSLALVYPSLYEGFGIPPLEAMSCGTVAVVSNASSLPEVVGDAGLLFDPRALDELTDILLSLTRDDALRRDLIEKGERRAREFSWAKTVAQTVEVYRSLAGT